MAGEAYGSGHVDPGGAAEAQTFMFQKVEHHRNGFFVGNLERDVDWGADEILRDAALPDSLGDRGSAGFQFAGGEIAVESGPHRVREPDRDLRIARLERH